MKTLVNTLMMVAAGTVALGSMAYGQTTLKAGIPFEFHVSGATLPAGTVYRHTEHSRRRERYSAAEREHRARRAGCQRSDGFL